MTYSKDFIYHYDLFKDEKSYEDIVDKLVIFFKKHNIRSVLDVGCGTGKIDKLLNDKGYEVVGIDKSKEMIEYAQKNYPEIPFKQMDAETFRFDKKFDAIIALDSVLTFLTKKGAFERAIENIVSHMKKGAFLFFNIGFTEELIPEDFTDHFFKEIEEEGVNYKKEHWMKRQGELLVVNIRIIKDDQVIIEEEHIHRIISEKPIIKMLSKLNCDVEAGSGSEEQDCRQFEVIAEKK